MTQSEEKRMDKETALKTAAGAAAAAGAAIGVKKVIEHVRSDEKASSADGNDETEASLADAEHYHLVPRGEEWALQKVGADRATISFQTKKSAVERAREMMKKMAPTVLVIHRADGTIEKQHAYGVA